MEIILETVKILCPLIATAINLCFFLKIQKVEKNLKEIEISIDEQYTDISNLNDNLSFHLNTISEKIDRSTLSLRKILETTEPIIKPNNWDSVREAFKGPTRVEINERN